MGGPDEEAEVAALRELEEETGYKATLQDVVECTPTVACDPGEPKCTHGQLGMRANRYAGMTTAKMKLVIVKVELEDKMEYPVANPDPGEHIVVRVIELSQLKRILQGTRFFRLVLACGANDDFTFEDYDKEVCETLCA